MSRILGALWKLYLLTYFTYVSCTFVFLTPLKIHARGRISAISIGLKLEFRILVDVIERLYLNAYIYPRERHTRGADIIRATRRTVVASCLVESH